MLKVLFSFLLAVLICQNGFATFKVVDLQQFLKPSSFKPLTRESLNQYSILKGSEFLVDNIKFGRDEFGKIAISYKLENKDATLCSSTGARVQKVLDSGDKTTVVISTREIECGYEIGKFENAISVELKYIKNITDIPLTVTELEFHQISPFSSPDLPDESEALTGKAQRAVRFAEDGRFMGVVSSASTLKKIDYGSVENLTHTGDALTSFSPMKKGDFLKPGEVRKFNGTWACYLIGKDLRDGWRQRTNCLDIFPRGCKKDILSARRRIQETINGKAIINGSITLDFSQAKKVEDKSIKERLCPEVASRILELDLSHIDLSYWCAPTNEFSLLSPPRKINWNSLVPRLYVNSEPMKLSTWPNDDWAIIAGFDNPGKYRPIALVHLSTNAVVEEISKPSFYYSGDRPSRWVKAEEVLVNGFWAYDWHNSVVRLDSIDTEKKIITLTHPTSFGIINGNSKDRRWRVYNLIEEIDQPYEYAINRKTKKLYFLPPLEFSKDTRISIAAGTNALYVCDGLKDVEFRNIVFEESPTKGVILTNCENVVFKNCVFRNMMREGVNIDKSCQDCVIDNCVFENFGFAAAVIDGGDKTVLKNGNNEVISSVIRNTSQGIAKTGNAIRLQGVGNAIRNCKIYNIPDIGIYFRGCNLALESCWISNICTVVDDNGAFYQGRNATDRGNVLKNNVFIDTGTEFRHGNAGVYFDDGDCGNVVFSNLFVKCGFPGRSNFGTVFSHGGFGNYVSYCKFIDCIRPFGSARWDEAKWKIFFEKYAQRKNNDLAAMKIKFDAYFPSIAKFNLEENVKASNYASDCAVDGSPIWRETKVPGERFPGIICGNWQTNRIEITRPCRWFDAFKKMPRSKKRP